MIMITLAEKDWYLLRGMRINTEYTRNHHGGRWVEREVKKGSFFC